MQTITRFATLALAVTLSVGPALAQQPVRRTSTKPAARPAASATRTAQTSVKKTALAPAPTGAVKTEAQTSATKPTSEPVVSRQTEAHAKPVAQSAPARPQLVKGTNGRHVYLNAGVGLAAYYGGGLPLGVSAEVDVKNNFSVGGSIDYFRYNYGYYSGGYTFIYAGARASYHLGEALNVQNSEFDPYIGASLGFRHAGYHDSYGYSYSDYGSGYNSGLWIGIHAGARYLFSPKIGAFAEVGYGVSALKVGLTAKF
ncbi:hypothetical protein [Spirosoma radiotolerans]|uniref:Outer membrane protein beta-barrel domain-containing protein n=1 Tax=Spirosoma radiotolerans TaxID=1379870 RepID=A0A0E3ZWK0_9BACT|nr:hypothetical protein [Spirosoma radiotolerans]AKD55754.1 hypothetical protein SD10_13435 [Spirosoma radiotolerans]